MSDTTRREWCVVRDGKTVAQRAADAQHTESDLDEMLCEAFGDVPSWDEDGPSFTTDYYDNSIEIYAPEISATPHALGILAEAGFSLAWVHPHERGMPNHGCPTPACPEHYLKPVKASEL